MELWAKGLCKITGALLVLATSGILGWKWGFWVKERQRLLEEWKRYLVRLSGEITYTRTVMPELLYALAEEGTTPFSGFFLEIAEVLEERRGATLAKVWREACVKYFSRSSLSAEEKHFLEELGNSLSIQETKALLQALQLQLQKLDYYLEKENAKLEEKLRLSRLISISFGIMLVVVLI